MPGPFALESFPPWLQGLGQQNQALAGQFGQTLGTDLAAGLLVAGGAKTAPDPLTGQSQPMTFGDAVAQVRGNQLDPMFGIKAQTAKAALYERTAQLQGQMATLQEQNEERAAWLQDAPVLAKWMAKSPKQRDADLDQGLGPQLKSQRAQQRLEQVERSDEMLDARKAQTQMQADWHAQQLERNQTEIKSAGNYEEGLGKLDPAAVTAKQAEFNANKTPWRQKNGSLSTEARLWIDQQFAAQGKPSPNAPAGVKSAYALGQESLKQIQARIEGQIKVNDDKIAKMQASDSRKEALRVAGDNAKVAYAAMNKAVKAQPPSGETDVKGWYAKKQDAIEQATREYDEAQAKFDALLSSKAGTSPTATRTAAAPTDLSDRPWLRSTPIPQSAGTVGTRAKPAQPKTRSDFDDMPSGTYYIDPGDGKLYRVK